MMMKKYNLFYLFIIIGIVSIYLTGCSTYKFDAEDTSLYIRGNGTAAAVVYEDFDTEVYSEEELKTYIENDVCSYNEKVAGDNRAYLDSKNKEDYLPVSITSLKIKDKTAVLKMEYASTQDYIDFNQEENIVTELACVPIADAAKENIALETITGTQVSDNSTVTFTSYADAEDMYILKIQGNMAVQFEGKVTAYTSGVTYVDKRDVTVAATGSETAYIVFNKK